jgi:hypothetical protein
MCFYNMLDDCQAKAGSSYCAAPAAVSTIEALEDAGKVFFADTGTVV